MFTIATASICAQPMTDSAGRTKFSRNIPKPDDYVNDYEHVLNDDEEEQLNLLAAKVQKETGLQFAMVTLKEEMVGTEPFDSLIFRIFNTWTVGQKNKNNGIVIGLSKSMRKVRITLGLGIPLTDEETKEILDEVLIPYLRKDELSTAMREGILKLAAKIESNRYRR